MKKLTVVTLLTLTMANVHAQTSETRNQFQSTTQSVQVELNMDRPRYGGYQLEPTLVAVPSSLADPKKVETKISEMSISRNDSSPATTGFLKNAVVRHVVTGELGILTGNVVVVLKSDTDLDQLKSEFALDVVKSVEDSPLLIVKPKQDEDLLQLTNRLRSSGLLNVVRMDILQNRNKAM